MDGVAAGGVKAKARFDSMSAGGGFVTLSFKVTRAEYMQIAKELSPHLLTNVEILVSAAGGPKAEGNTQVSGPG